MCLCPMVWMRGSLSTACLPTWRAGPSRGQVCVCVCVCVCFCVPVYFFRLVCVGGCAGVGVLVRQTRTHTNIRRRPHAFILAPAHLRQRPYTHTSKLASTHPTHMHTHIHTALEMFGTRYNPGKWGAVGPELFTEAARFVSNHTTYPIEMENPSTHAHIHPYSRTSHPHSHTHTVPPHTQRLRCLGLGTTQGSGGLWDRSFSRRRRGSCPTTPPTPLRCSRTMTSSPYTGRR